MIYINTDVVKVQFAHYYEVKQKIIIRGNLNKEYSYVENVPYEMLITEGILEHVLNDINKQLMKLIKNDIDAQR